MGIVCMYVYVCVTWRSLSTLRVEQHAWHVNESREILYMCVFRRACAGKKCGHMPHGLGQTLRAVIGRACSPQQPTLLWCGLAICRCDGSTTENLQTTNMHTWVIDEITASFGSTLGPWVFA